MFVSRTNLARQAPPDRLPAAAERWGGRHPPWSRERNQGEDARSAGYRIPQAGLPSQQISHAEPGDGRRFPARDFGLSPTRVGCEEFFVLPLAPFPVIGIVGGRL